jgi:hypothetical protein
MRTLGLVNFIYACMWIIYYIITMCLEVYARRHLFLSLLRVAWIYSLVGGSARAYTLAGSRYRPRIRHTLLKELWLRALGQ